jgi:hypothetical protein
MQPPSTASQSITPYEHQARDAALCWSQLALASNDPSFDIQSSQQRDMYGTIVGSHRLSVESQIRRWCGKVGAASDDIVCDSREDFDEGLAQQGLLALYDESTHQQLTQSITGAPYAALREPAFLPTRSRRLRYHQLCDDCGSSGTHTCATCRGEGETSCSSCAGCGSETCNSCGGSGQQEVGHTDSHGQQHSEWANCPGCNGNGHVHCGGCGGSGQQTCGTCQRSGKVSCVPCEGTGSFTHIGQVAVLHTPTYRVTFDPGTPDAWYHVLNFFGHAGFAEPATVILDSIQRVDESSTSTALVFRYRFQLPAAQLKVKTREDILGSGDYSEWTVAGKTPEVIDCEFALFPLLVGSTFNVRRDTQWRTCVRPGFNPRMQVELSELLAPAVHQWIIDGANRNLSLDAIFIQIRRSLDPNSINAIIETVTHALKTTYRRRLVLHQTAAMAITLIGVYVMNAAPDSNLWWLPSLTSGHVVDVSGGFAGMFILLGGVLLSFQLRHRAWLTRAGGAALRERAAQLGHLKLLRASLQIVGAALIVAFLLMVMMKRL